MSASTSTPRRNTTTTRAERDRLRDYYGLGSPDTAADSSSSQARRPTEAPPVGDSATKYKQLIKDQGIAGLLKAQSDLLTEIRELDGERQSLVYNHHTDLVEASETIRKMKAHSDSLSPTLTSLTSSFDNMAKLSQQLKTSLQPALSPPPQPAPLSNSSIEPSRDLIPIVTLPRRLRDIIVLGRGDANTLGRRPSSSSASTEEYGLPAAEALWGRHESVLSAWVQAGIPGAADVAAECRAVLKEARERPSGGEEKR